MYFRVGYKIMYASTFYQNHKFKFFVGKKGCKDQKIWRTATTRCTTSGPRERGHHDNVQEQKICGWRRKRRGGKMWKWILELSITYNPFINMVNLYTCISGTVSICTKDINCSKKLNYLTGETLNAIRRDPYRLINMNFYTA